MFIGWDTGTYWQGQWYHCRDPFREISAYQRELWGIRWYELQSTAFQQSPHLPTAAPQVLRILLCLICRLATVISLRVALTLGTEFGLMVGYPGKTGYWLLCLKSIIKLIVLNSGRMNHVVEIGMCHDGQSLFFKYELYCTTNTAF